MEGKKFSALNDAVQGLSRRRSLADLQQRGVRTVRTISTRQIGLLVEESVRRTLANQLGDRVAPQELEELTAEASARVVELIHRLQELNRYREGLRQRREELAGTKTKDDQVSRRLRKISDYLAETEQAVEQALDAMHSFLPTRRATPAGGVDPSDPQRRHKEQMLRGVFEANRDSEAGSG